MLVECHTVTEHAEAEDVGTGTSTNTAHRICPRAHFYHLLFAVQSVKSTCNRERNNLWGEEQIGVGTS